jgi:hypothetical protein
VACVASAGQHRLNVTAEVDLGRGTDGHHGGKVRGESGSENDKHATGVSK